jgi:hypothetical protein
LGWQPIHLSWEGRASEEKSYKRVVGADEIVAAERWVAQLDDHNFVGALSNKEVVG